MEKENIANPNIIELNTRTKTEDLKPLCKFAFDIVYGILSNKKEKKQVPINFSTVQSPIFITWEKNGKLRGCIGTFERNYLEKLLPLYSIMSAFKDKRFPPIRIEELEDISCGVSLLINFQETSDIYDWEVGKNGIIIDFEHQGRKYHATYLPEVASDRKWSKEEALQSLIKKSGSQAKVKEIEDCTRLTKYESIRAHMDYSEWSKS